MQEIWFKTQIWHVVESTRVLNNHETYFYFFVKQTEHRHTGSPVEVPPVLKKFELNIVGLVLRSVIFIIEPVIILGIYL